MSVRKLDIVKYKDGTWTRLADDVAEEALDLPATQPVPVYPVKIEGDDVYVDLDNPITQES